MQLTKGIRILFKDKHVSYHSNWPFQFQWVICDQNKLQFHQTLLMVKLWLCETRENFMWLSPALPQSLELHLSRLTPFP